MANRIHNALLTPKEETVLLTARLQGAGAAALTNDEDFAFASDVSAVSRTSTGLFAITFRHKYPQLLSAPEPAIIGSTAGLKARWSALDVAAGTGTLRVEREGGSSVPAWSSAIAVAANTTGALALGAGWITAVTITAGGVTGAGNLRSTAPANSRDIQVVYTAGVATLNTLAGDAVTEVVVQHQALGTLTDPATTDAISFTILVRNRND